MNDLKNTPNALEKRYWPLRLSLICGGVAWAIILLNFTSIFGNSFSRIFWFVPPAILGFFAGTVSYFKCQRKLMAGIAIAVNGLSLAVLVLIIVLLTRSGGFRE